jgi:membrane-bound lytic murein transglycosylase B
VRAAGAGGVVSRSLVLACVLTLVWTAGGSVLAQDPPQAFSEWLDALRKEALQRGISAGTVNEALGDLQPLQVVVERDRTQAEVTLTLDQYLKRRLTPRFVARARETARAEAALLRRVTAAYEVGGSMLVAIWGMESNFGRFSGTWPTIQALATLAYDPHRPALFRKELFAALEILDRRDIDLASMKGSWAGAMGQPQFMPSSYLQFAVDFDGDARRDIWSSTADVLASMANYLKAHGWVAGYRWGREVRVAGESAAQIAASVPLRVMASCTAMRQMTEPRPLAAWRAFGVTQVTGGPLPVVDVSASLLRVENRTFLVYQNYEALLSYNCAHAYALAVGMLADLLGGN